MIGDGAIVAEHDVAVEAAEEPAVVGDGDDRSLELGEALLERFGRDEIEVVGRLVEQQQGCAAQFEQQDLEAGLLAARQRVERLLRATVQLVATEHSHRRPEYDVVVVEDVDRRATGPLGVLVRLMEQAGVHSRSQAAHAVVRDGG